MRVTLEETCLFGLTLLCTTAPARAALTISNAPTQNIVCASQVCSASAAMAVLNIGDLTAMLAAGDLKVASGTDAQDIVVANEFVATVQAGSFTLDAARSIRFERPVAIAGNGGVSLVTNDGGTNGSLSFSPKGRLHLLRSSHASLIINGVTYDTLRSIVDLSQYIGTHPDGHFAFVQDYDAIHDGNYSFTPITTLLTGTVEGLGNTISNFHLYATRSLAVGLFNGVGAIGGGVIQNLRMKDVDIRTTGKSSVGGLANYALGGTFINDTVSGTIVTGGASTVGGLLAGSVYTYVTGCLSTVTISAPKSSLIGDLVGDLTYSDVRQSIASGAVSGGSQSTVGGIVGEDYDGNVINSYATGSVSVTNGIAGGVTGYMTGGSIQYSYAVGRVTGRQTSNVGGLAGAAGGNGRLTPYIVDGYWDVNTTRQTVGVGGPVTVGGSVGLTTAQLKSALPAGFDPTIWAQTAGVNDGLPYLVGITPQ